MMTKNAPEETAVSHQKITSAIQTFEWQQAIALVTHTLTESHSDDEQFQLLSWRAQAYHSLGLHVEETADLQQMLSLAQTQQDVGNQMATLLKMAIAARVLGKQAMEQTNVEQAMLLATQVADSALLARGHFAMGRIHKRRGEIPDAEREFDQAYQLYQQAEDKAGQARTLRELAWVWTRKGSLDRANELLEQALGLCQEIGDRSGEGDVRNMQGVLSFDLAQKRTYYEQALAIYEIIGKRHKQIIIYNNLALIYLNLGLYGQCLDYIQPAIAHARENEARNELAYSLDVLGRSSLALGLVDQAEQAFTEGLAISQEMGHQELIGYYNFGLGQARVAQGDLVAAQQRLQVGAEALGSSVHGDRAVALAWLGLVQLHLGDWQTAVATTQQAITILEEGHPQADYPAAWAWWYHYLVVSAAPQPDPARCWHVLEQAQALMLAGIDKLGDEGLRRNYLNRAAPNSAILQEWVAQAVAQQRPLTPLTQTFTRQDSIEEQLQRMLRIGVRINARRQVQDLPRFIMGEIVELCGADRAALYLLDDSNEWRLVAENTTQPDANWLDSIQPALQEAIHSRQAILHEIGDEADITNQRSIICVPLIAQGKLVGLLYADLLGIYGRFTQNDLDLLVVLANQAAVAVENATWASTLEQRVAERTAALEQRTQELTAINAVGRDISATLDLNAVLEQIAEHAQRLLNADASAVYLPDASGKVLRATVAKGAIADRILAHPVPLGVGIIGHLAQQGRAEFVNDATRDPRAGTIPDTPENVEEKLMAAPLFTGSQVSGMMAIWRGTGGEPFSEDDLNFVQALAQQTAVALENARLYSEAQAARLEAEAASEAKSSFLANMSHELRTPLNAIMGFTRIVKRRGQEALPEKQLDNLDKVLVSADHLLSLINTVLDIAKIEAQQLDVQRTEFDLIALVELCVMTIRPLLKPDVVIYQNITRDSILITSDEEKAKQILLNLLSNAAKFTYEGAIQVAVAVGKTEVAISVQDTGIGIPPEKLEVIFEAFKQADDSSTRQFGGTGLGLSISRQLARLLGGDITATSTLGKGSAFTLTLPVKLES
ncbi:GAF domain-containing protein [Candidatus Leptofilum sp.]|uniref:GAF domain-containing protein n=1 Tax=Candidatus Leptofilum sp. TaxID=3241576 RepID=UPI003B58D2F2